MFLPWLFWLVFIVNGEFPCVLDMDDFTDVEETYLLFCVINNTQDLGQFKFLWFLVHQGVPLAWLVSRKVSHSWPPHPVIVMCSILCVVGDHLLLNTLEHLPQTLAQGLDSLCSDSEASDGEALEISQKLLVRKPQLGSGRRPGESLKEHPREPTSTASASPAAGLFPLTSSPLFFFCFKLWLFKTLF